MTARQRFVTGIVLVTMSLLLLAAAALALPAKGESSGHTEQQPAYQVIP
jgi:hypothetical protein